MISVHPLVAADRETWFALWQGYLDFYETALATDVSESTWRRLLDPAQPMHGLVAVDDGGRIVGILNYVLHLNTWSDKPVCYLEDLFVAPEARGQGAGRALIESLVGHAHDAGWLRVYWMTRSGNAPARALYDRIGRATDWVRYDVNL